MVESRIWYVGYGSNVSAERLRIYLPAEETDGRYAGGLDSRWLWLERHQLYFAGRTKTWNGAAAFCSLVQQPKQACPARAYALSYKDIGTVLAKENGMSAIDVDIRKADLAIHDWKPLPVALAEDGFRGKYNALLRLPDVDGDPAYTLTTSRLLTIGAPSQDYLDIIASGLAPFTGDQEAQALLKQAAAVTTATNRDFVGQDSTKTVAWSGTVSAGGSTGFPAVLLPMVASGSIQSVSLRPGTLSTEDGTEIQLWVSYSLNDDGDPTVTPDVADLLGLSPGTHLPVRVESLLPMEVPQLPGRAGDIPPPDVLHVDSDLANRLGRWALVITPQVSGPARVLERTHVPPGEIRVAYGVRTLFGLDRKDTLQLTPILMGASRPGDPNTVRGRLLGLIAAVRLGARRIGEWLLGAPAITLRATEGLVGDDGRAVVRIDTTVLDYLGIAPGDQAVISWASRSTKTRVLLQTDETRERMQQQLLESTGKQSRASLTDPTSRSSIPSHLRVWVSPTVRHRLAIPPDTVVRLRRSLPHVVGRNAASLSLPFVGLAIAALAVPNVAGWVWAIVITIALILALLPLRLVDRTQSRRP